MNIVQIHDAIFNWLDRVGSPRFTTDRVDGALNGVIDQIVEENYDRLRGDPMLYFEANSKVRAMLVNLVKTFYNGKYLKIVTEGPGVPSGAMAGTLILRYGTQFASVASPYAAANIQTAIRTFTGLGTATVTGLWTTSIVIELLPDNDDRYYNELVIDESSTLYLSSSGAVINPRIARNYNSTKAATSSMSYDPYFLRRDELPTNMRYIVSFKVNIEGNNYFLKNITKIDKNELFQNPYKEPSLDYPERQFFDEIYEGINLYCGADDTIYRFEVVYIKIPALVTYGIVHAAADSGITVATPGIVITTTATINAVNYVFGDEVSFTSALLTAGSVVYGYVNPELGEMVYQDIVFRTAVALLIKVGENDKAGLLLGLKK